MKVWSVISDVGLNGALLHGAFSERPTDAEMNEFIREAHKYTGYSGTWALETDLNTHGPWDLTEGKQASYG